MDKMLFGVNKIQEVVMNIRLGIGFWDRISPEILQRIVVDRDRSVGISKCSH